MRKMRYPVRASVTGDHRMRDKEGGGLRGCCQCLTHGFNPAPTPSTTKTTDTLVTAQISRYARVSGPAAPVIPFNMTARSIGEGEGTWRFSVLGLLCMATRGVSVTMAAVDDDNDVRQLPPTLPSRESFSDLGSPCITRQIEIPVSAIRQRETVPFRWKRVIPAWDMLHGPGELAKNLNDWLWCVEPID